MNYKMIIERTENSPDFLKKDTQDEYYSIVYDLNHHWILFGSPNFQPDRLEITVERCDNEGKILVEAAFETWGKIVYPKQ